jgi:hypothetical protein
MKKKLFPLILFIIIAVIFGFWAMEMTASEPDTLKFYLIYIPLIIFLVLQFYFFVKIRTSSENIVLLKVTSFCILPISLLLFLFFSFGEAINKICVSGDCENGYGEALYIKSEQTLKSANEWNDGEIQYYKPEFLGRNWFNNIVWYDGNPIRSIYKGEFKNGFFHGDGVYFWFFNDYGETLTGYNTWNDKSDDFINRIYYISGQFERGRRLWDEETRSSGIIEMKDDIKKMLKKYNLDKQGFYSKDQPTLEAHCNSSRLYGEIEICLPEIDGMKEVYSYSQVKERSDLFSYENNTILGLYLSKKNFSAIDNFENEALDDYFKIYALKQTEGIEIGKSDFDEMIEYSKGNFIEKSWEDIIDNVLSGTDNMSIGQPVRIEAYKPTEDVFTMVLLIKMISGEEERIVVCTLNMVRLKNSLIYYAYYKNYTSAKTLELVKAKSDFFGYKLIEINQ